MSVTWHAAVIADGDGRQARVGGWNPVHADNREHAGVDCDLVQAVHETGCGLWKRGRATVVGGAQQAEVPNQDCRWHVVVVVNLIVLTAA